MIKITAPLKSTTYVTPREHPNPPAVSGKYARTHVRHPRQCG